MLPSTLEMLRLSENALRFGGFRDSFVIMKLRFIFDFKSGSRQQKLANAA
jgi:hypothetical protein